MNRIKVSGLYTGIPSDVYHADPCYEPSLSSGIARALLAQSPRHAWAAHPRLNPRYRPSKSRDFDLGTAAHAVLLEDGADRIMVLDAKDYRTKAAQELRDQALEAGRMPLLTHQADQVSEMVLSARAYLSRCELQLDPTEHEAEATIIWQDAGAWCRARPDMMIRGQRMLLDYKTTQGSAEPGAWIRGQMTSLGYDIQAAHYLTGANAIGLEDYRFAFLVQEAAPPYACSLVGVGPAMLDLALRKIDYAIRTWGACMAAGEWPAYPDQVCWADPKPWAEGEWEERRQLIDTRAPSDVTWQERMSAEARDS